MRSAPMMGVIGVLGCLAGTAHADLHNVAPLGKARQSTTEFGGDASRANDGEVNGLWAWNSVTHTTKAAGSWLEIDLAARQTGNGGMYFYLDSGYRPRISEVVVHNRADCCRERLDGAYVFLSDEPCDKQASIVATTEAMTGGKPRHRFSFPSRPSARYACVRNDKAEHLSVAEVEVFVDDGIPATLPRVNLARSDAQTNAALWAAARMSSTASGSNAGRLIDNDTLERTPFSSTGTLAMTGTATNNWQEINLGTLYPIDTVTVFNRTDSKKTQLVGAVVELSELPCDVASTQPVAKSSGADSSAVQAFRFAGAVAQYVCLRKSSVPIGVREIQVTIAPPIDRLVNLARGKSTSATSTAVGTTARLVDGDTNGYAPFETGTATKFEKVQIDLGAPTAIGSIIVHLGAARHDRNHTAALLPSNQPCSAMTVVPGMGVNLKQHEWGLVRYVDFGEVLTARYVCIYNINHESLAISEIEVFGPMTPTSSYPPVVRQSSTGYGGDVSRVNDGQTSGLWAHYSVSNTAATTSGYSADSAPFVELDLRVARPIGEIVVYNRTDCCTERLGGARIELSLDPCDNPQRRIASEEIFPARSTSFHFTGGLGTETLEHIPKVTRHRLLAAPTARYVCIRHDSRRFLALAEVEVYPGIPYENLALAGEATQSDLSNLGHAANAIDGWINGVFAQGSVTETTDWTDPPPAGTPLPWFQIDLKASKQIRAVEVYNRLDEGKREWLTGARVELRDVPCDQAITHDPPAGLITARKGSSAPPRRTRIDFPDLPHARYVCVRHTTYKSLSLAEVMVFGVGLQTAPPPEPPNRGVAVATAHAPATTTAEMGWGAPVPEPVATTGDTTGETKTLAISYAGLQLGSCDFAPVAGQPSQWDMTCGAFPDPIRMRGTISSVTSYDLDSVEPVGLDTLLGSTMFGSFPAKLREAFRDAGLPEVYLGLESTRAFFLWGTLDLDKPLLGTSIVSSTLGRVHGFLDQYIPGYSKKPVFELVPALSAGTLSVTLRLYVINACGGAGSIGPLGTELKFQSGALVFSVGASGGSVSMTGGFEASSYLRLRDDDKWMAFYPAFDLGASLAATGATPTVALKGRISGACSDTCVATCSCQLTDCDGVWSPPGLPAVSLTQGYVELGASVTAAKPVPLINLAFDDVKIGDRANPAATGTFAMAFDYSEGAKVGFLLQADRMPLSLPFDLVGLDVSSKLPAALAVRDPVISFSSTGVALFDVTIPAGLRIKGGVELPRIGLRGSVDASLTGSGLVDADALSQGNLEFRGAGFDGKVKISLDVGDMVDKVLRVGGFDVIARPIVERALFITGIDVWLQVGGTVGLGASVRLRLLGNSVELPEVGFSFDLTQLARAIATYVFGEIGGALKAVFDKAVKVAEQVAKDIAAALLTGVGIVVDGVLYVASKVVNVAEDAGDFFEDGWGEVSDFFSSW